MCNIENPFLNPKLVERYDSWYDTEKGKAIFLKELNIVKKLIGKGNILEIGAGTCRFSEKLNSIALDPSINMLKHRKNNIIKVCGYCENLPFKNKLFDYIVFITTIEFIENIKQCLKEVRRVIKDNGRLIVCFINKNSELGRLYNVKRKTNPFYKRASFYSPEEMESILNLNRFKTISTHSTLEGSFICKECIPDS